MVPTQGYGLGARRACFPEFGTLTYAEGTMLANALLLRIRRRPSAVAPHRPAYWRTVPLRSSQDGVGAAKETELTVVLLSWAGHPGPPAVTMR